MSALLPPLSPWATLVVVAGCALSGALLGDLAMRLHRYTDPWRAE